jgi:hypothetical protein
LPLTNTAPAATGPSGCTTAGTAEPAADRNDEWQSQAPLVRVVSFATRWLIPFQWP